MASSSNCRGKVECPEWNGCVSGDSLNVFNYGLYDEMVMRGNDGGTESVADIGK